MKKYLICWIENNIKRWDMIKEEDHQEFCLNLLTNQTVDKHSIFIIPINGFIEGIWLWYKTHKNNRVDFFNFFDDLGVAYEPPKHDKKNDEVLKEIHERHFTDKKYGWISPDGKYFYCDYQGHHNVADRICFGMIETNSPVRYLEEHGWCKIYKPIHGTYAVYVGGDHRLTEAQTKTLVQLGLENAKDVDEMICKE